MVVFGASEEKLEQFVGTYRGWYYANQGHTGLTLNVYKDEVGAYKATFNFYSVPENPSVPSGEYVCDVLYKQEEDSYYIKGQEWIVKPQNYNFVDLDGFFKENLYKGNVVTSTRTFAFELVKQINENAASTWADDIVNSAIVRSYVPLELQSDYKSKITRADFARLTIAAISLKSDMNIESFMSSKNVKIKNKPFEDTSDLFVTYANSLGVVNGYGNALFGPNDSITREQAAVMLYNLANVYGVDTNVKSNVNFQDKSEFSNWALKSIDFVTNYKGAKSDSPVMSGYNNRFTPKDGYTREQAIITIYKLINAID
jgi:hypothetical protein